MGGQRNSPRATTGSRLRCTRPFPCWPPSRLRARQTATPCPRACQGTDGVDAASMGSGLDPASACRSGTAMARQAGRAMARSGGLTRNGSPRRPPGEVGRRIDRPTERNLDPQDL